MSSNGSLSENKRKTDKYLDPAQEIKKKQKKKKRWNIKVTVIPIVVSALGMTPKGWGKKTQITGNHKIRGHLDSSCVKISYNTQKSPGDQMKLAVTQPRAQNIN